MKRKLITWKAGNLSKRLAGIVFALLLCLSIGVTLTSVNAYAAEGDADYQEFLQAVEGKTLIRITYDPDSIEWNGKTWSKMTEALNDATKVDLAGELRVYQYSLQIGNYTWDTPDTFSVFRKVPVMLYFSPNPDYDFNASEFNADDYLVIVNDSLDATVELVRSNGSYYVRVSYYPEIPDSQKYFLDKDEYKFTLNGEKQYLKLGNDWKATDVTASDPSVLEFGKIDLSTKQIPVIPKNSGTTVVTVSDKDGNSASCNVTIEDDRMPLKDDPEWGLRYYPMKHYTYTMDVGEKAEISDIYGYRCTRYTSTDPDVADVILGDEDAWGEEEYDTHLCALSPGTSLITLYDKDGLATVLLTVRDKTHSLNSKYNGVVPYAFDIQTGCNYTLTMDTWDESQITVKDYKGNERVLSSVTSSNTKVVKASLYEDEDDDEEDGIFYLRAKTATGTSTVTIVDDKGATSTIKITVKEGRPGLYIDSRVYASTRKVKVESWCLKKGDIIKLKVGRKTYKKKITKAAGWKTLTFKISKPGFYGKTIKATVVRKGKIFDSDKAYVYLGTKIRKGYTKKQVRWLTSWGKPDRITKTSKTERWYYDRSNDKYVFFRNGRVIDWIIYY